MKVVVDDQLALLANLGALQLPPDVERPLLTVYGFQLRIASAVSVERATEGVLQRLLQSHLRSGAQPASLADRESGAVRVVDPTRFALEVARVRVELRCNSLAAEMVALARREGAHVRLSPGNARGQLWKTLTTAGVPSAIWTVVPTHGGMSVTVTEQHD